MAGWVAAACNPVALLVRLEVLLSEYPFLCGRGLVLPAVLIVVAPLASAGKGNRAWEVIFYAALCAFYLALLVSMHFYDSARRRLQALAQARGVGIHRDCCFTSPELHDSFETWRIKGAFWRVLDWVAVTFTALYVVKLVGLTKGVCGPPHLLWALGASVSSVLRVLFPDRLSPRQHSMLSMFSFTYSWVTRCVLLLYGDKCVVASMGQQLYSGSVAAGVFTSVLIHVTAHLLNQVSQAFFPWKLVSGLVGYTMVGYLNILRLGDGIDWEVDSERWGLLVLVICQVMLSLAILHFCTILSETGMQKFLANRITTGSRGAA